MPNVDYTKRVWRVVYRDRVNSWRATTWVNAETAKEAFENVSKDPNEHVGTFEYTVEVDPNSGARIGDVADFSASNVTSSVRCKFCQNYADASTAHRHEGGWVGDECCWDERLRTTE